MFKEQSKNEMFFVLVIVPVIFSLFFIFELCRKAVADDIVINDNTVARMSCIDGKQYVRIQQKTLRLVDEDGKDLVCR